MRPRLPALLDAQARERDRLLAEVLKIKGLMPLLMKHRNGQRWTPAERRELKSQLKALGEISPYLIVLVLPGSFVLIPMLAWWIDRRRIQRGRSSRPTPA